jgi:hypothetical protein
MEIDILDCWFWINSQCYLMRGWITLAITKIQQETGLCTTKPGFGRKFYEPFIP